MYSAAIFISQAFPIQTKRSAKLARAVPQGCIFHPFLFSPRQRSWGTSHLRTDVRRSRDCLRLMAFGTSDGPLRPNSPAIGAGKTDCVEVQNIGVFKKPL